MAKRLTCGAGLFPTNCAMPYQRESKSAARCLFSSRKRIQESVHNNATGTLTTAQAITPPAAARPKAGSVRVRQHSASSGTKKSTG